MINKLELTNQNKLYYKISQVGDLKEIYYIFQLFLFTILPLDDGLIDEADLREVMKACMVENGMEFDQIEVSALANALFEDAVRVRILL